MKHTISVRPRIQIHLTHNKSTNVQRVQNSTYQYIQMKRRRENVKNTATNGTTVGKFDVKLDKRRLSVLSDVVPSRSRTRVGLAGQRQSGNYRRLRYNILLLHQNELAARLLYLHVCHPLTRRQQHKLENCPRSTHESGGVYLSYDNHRLRRFLN